MLGDCNPISLAPIAAHPELKKEALSPHMEEEPKTLLLHLTENDVGGALLDITVARGEASNFKEAMRESHGKRPRIRESPV